ncbi:colicin V biosynthesis protein [Alphaproteobacteria bacterium]|nr:colicin V biosynthesis protein [Alphaproteobacteria bacterium]
MNAVDIAVLVVLGASGLFALIRGFVHEVLAVAGWVAAVLAALWCLPLVRPLLAPYVVGDYLPDIVGGGVVFVVVLVASSFPVHAVGRKVRSSVVGPLDRTMGFLFGVARGVFVASLCFIVVIKLWHPGEPDLLKGAKTRPLLVAGQKMIFAVVPENVFAVDGVVNGSGNALDELRKGQQMYEDWRRPKPAPAQPSAPPAYDRQDMDRLIDNNNR